MAKATGGGDQEAEAGDESMKTIAKQYFETLEQSRRCKPRSERKAILTERLKKLVVRQLRKEVRAA